MFQSKGSKQDKLLQSQVGSNLHQNDSRQGVSKTGTEATTTNGNEVNDSSNSKKVSRYSSERVIGSGSFGVVYKAASLKTKDVVAIKKVREDSRYKNRELQMMKIVKHPNVVMLKDCFYSKNNRELYLNLVMEYIPETLYVTIRNHAKAEQTIPFILTKLYSYQICRALAYCHQRGICHRDIKPQNLLLDPDTHTVKLCDFGSAKQLKEGEPNVAYICSRYYRAPELIFESSVYRTSIDTWSLGCVMGEMYLTTPLFQGEKSVDQLVEIIKVLGTPTRREIMAMNPQYTYNATFPAVKPLPWKMVFDGITYEDKRVPDDATDILSKLLVFSPSERLDEFDALAHPYFDELRLPDLLIPGCKKAPELFNFTPDEIELAVQRKIAHRIVPKKYWEQYNLNVNANVNEKNKKMNGFNHDATKPRTSDTSSHLSSEHDYVLLRVQEIADQRQQKQEPKVNSQKSNTGQS